MDSATGLYYLRTIYYDPPNGRFTQEDSYLGEENNPLTLNLYGYCHGNPVMYRDLSGHITAQILEAITGAIAGALIEVVVQSFTYFLKRGNLKSFKTNGKKVALAACWGDIFGTFSMTKFKRLKHSVITGFIFGAIGDFISGAGFGAKHYQKSIFSKGGYYRVDGVSYRSLPIFQKQIFKSFARTLTGYVNDLILNLIQSRV